VCEFWGSALTSSSEHKNPPAGFFHGPEILKHGATADFLVEFAECLAWAEAADVGDDAARIIAECMVEKDILHAGGER
jgi:hypothetical protein